jgi:hypothetical protein
LLAAASTALCSIGAGCASIRVTNPPQTATEQFLMSQAAADSIARLSVEPLRGRAVYLDSTYLTSAKEPSDQQSFLLGELRSRLLLSGVRLVHQRDKAKIILEVRSGALGVDRIDYLLGIPSLYFGGIAGGAGTNALPLATPELAIVKNTKQKGYADVAFVAYWADTGEVVAGSGPFVGRTRRSDWWFFGFGPRTSGDIPTVDNR